MNALRTLALLAAVGCAQGTDTAAPAPGLDVLSARCDDLNTVESAVMGWTRGDTSDPTVLLTSGALWYYGDPDDVSTMGKEPDADGDVQVAYLGDCPDHFRVFIMLK